MKLDQFATINCNYRKDLEMSSPITTPSHSLPCLQIPDQFPGCGNEKQKYGQSQTIIVESVAEAIPYPTIVEAEAK